MTKNFLILTVILLSHFIPTFAQNGSVVIGKTDSIYSKVLSENRKLLIHVPQGKLENETFPVIYLLDARSNFEHTVATMKYLSEGGNQYWPPMIVVGIVNTDRVRDLTPYPIDSSSIVSNRFYKNSGGGENFMNFMVKELIPYIDDNYPTKPYRTFIGHSYGGLMAVHALLNYTDHFNNFIAIDPSLWWDNGSFNENAIKGIESRKFVNKSLHVSISDPEIDNLDLEGLAKDTSIFSAHLREIIKFVNAADQNSQNKLQFDSKFYKNENHISIPLISTYNALHSTFSWYRFENPYQFFENSLSTDKLVEMVETHFNLLTAKFGYEVLPPENWINGYGYEFMWGSKYEKAFAFFSMNIRNYPESSSVYDSMAEYYSSQNDLNKAIEYYNKVLELNPSEEVRSKISRLKEDKSH